MLGPCWPKLSRSVLPKARGPQSSLSPGVREASQRAPVTPMSRGEGPHEKEEADAVERDAADAPREGIVPERRRRPEGPPHAAAGRAEQLPEHQAARLFMTRTP